MHISELSYKVSYLYNNYIIVTIFTDWLYLIAYIGIYACIYIFNSNSHFNCTV